MSSVETERAPPSAVKPLIRGVTPLGRLAAALLVGLVRLLSPGARRALTRFVGFAAYALGIRRGVVLENLAHAFPEKPVAERRAIARGAYRNMALAALEALTSSGWSREELEARVRIEGWEPLAQALAAGRGVLVATAHFGSWELFGEVMARRGIPLNAVVRPLEGALNARIVESRQRAGIRLILQRGALKGMLAALRRGETVAQLIDQALPSKSAVWAPFFGRPASTTPALTVAALRTGAPVFVVLAARQDHGLRMFVEGPIPVEHTGDRDHDVRAHVAALSAVLERYIRRYPEQWMWLHRRWKGRPPDGAPTG